MHFCIAHMFAASITDRRSGTGAVNSWLCAQAIPLPPPSGRPFATSPRCCLPLCFCLIPCITLDGMTDFWLFNLDVVSSTFVQLSTVTSDSTVLCISRLHHDRAHGSQLGARRCRVGMPRSHCSHHLTANISTTRTHN